MRFLFTVFFLLLISAVGFAQDNYDVDLIPANLRNRANACIRNEETTIDMRSPDNVMLNVKKPLRYLTKMERMKPGWYSITIKTFRSKA